MAPAWRAAPLPKAHCAAAAAIEATATEPWTEAQLLQELDAPAGRLFGLYAGETRSVRQRIDRQRRNISVRLRALRA